MDAPKANPERQTSLMTVDESPQVVFQPQKLTEIVEMIDLMGRISERMGEDRSGDMGAAGAQGTGQQGQQTQTSARDAAIASLPATPAMQQKLVAHIRSEMYTLDKQARKLARAGGKGSAYNLNELYRKMRRLSALIEEIIEASADMIRRFYIAMFVDQQPLLMSEGGVLNPTNTK